MAEGKLIFEIYEYSSSSLEMPAFEYVLCNLSTCMRHSSQAPLSEILQKGFDDLPKGRRDNDKREELLQLLDEANFGKINVLYKPASDTRDACIELTNVVPVSLYGADARQSKKDVGKDSIILYGRYRLTDGDEVTALQDAQRLSLIFSGTEEADSVWSRDASFDDGFPEELRREICLNITYLQE